MLKTLYAKLALGLIALLAATGGIYILITSVVMHRYLQDIHLQLNRNLARNLVADRDLVTGGKLNEPALKETFRKYMAINPGIEIYLLDLRGNILSYSADPGKVKRKRVSLAPILSFLNMKEPGLILGDDPRSHNKRKAFSVTPVPSERHPEGYLYVVLRGEQFDAAEQSVHDSYLWKISGWTLAISLALGLLTGLIVFYFPTRRLRRLAGMMDAFALTHGLPAQSRADAADEIDQLALAFERMAGRIDDQNDRLKEQDAQRRRFIAQISHDLRTPLSAMLGYLESLDIKRDALSDGERRAFLATALRQGKRLRDLTEKLFELSSLEAQESAPDNEPFSISELAHDAIRKHRAKADARGIETWVQSAPDLPFARGDVGLTERALDNLMDNALTHTEKGGFARLEVASEGDWIVVTVSDNGKGIPENARSRVFDPMFKLYETLEGESHAGLGLAIAKRCVELQGGDIRLETAEGQGSRFIFRLPACTPTNADPSRRT